jgi:hypothetical protein
MDDRNTDPRFLILLLASLNYIQAKDKPKNPFVKSFGVSASSDEAYAAFLDAVKDCEDFFPELDEMIEILSATPDEIVGENQA